MKQKDILELIERWRDTGVVSLEQAGYMKAEVEAITKETSGNRFITTIMLFGAAALSLGVLLVIASNWRYFGDGIKTLIALLLPVLPLTFAYVQLVARQKSTVLARAANVLGVALIGGSLALIGQIYNLEADYTRFLYTWTFLSLPFIYVFKRPENVLVSVVMLGASIVASLFDWFSSSSDETGFIITLTLAALIYAAACYQVGNLLRHVVAWATSARLLRLWAATVGSVTLFITTFEFYARLATGSDLYSYGRTANNDWVPLMIILNITFILFLVFVLVRAYRYQEASLAVSTVRLFGIYLIAKYITLFSEMLDTGVFMILGGVLFISGAWFLERNKSYIVHLMRQEAPPRPPAQPVQQDAGVMPPQ